MAEAFESGTGEYSLLLEEQAHTTDQRNRLEQIEITEGNAPTTTDTHVYDHAGQLVADAEYWYQYDAFGRLASVHGRGDLTFLSSGTISGGTPGAWRLYLAYDGLGRLIREQKPWDGGTDHRQAWFYYDGVRRISEVGRRGAVLLTPQKKSKRTEQALRRTCPERRRVMELWRDEPDLVWKVYGLRAGIERVFSALTCDGGGLGPLPAWVRGRRRVTDWVTAKIALYNARVLVRIDAA